MVLIRCSTLRSAVLKTGKKTRISQICDRHFSLFSRRAPKGLLFSPKNNPVLNQNIEMVSDSQFRIRTIISTCYKFQKNIIHSYESECVVFGPFSVYGYVWPSMGLKTYRK